MHWGNTSGWRAGAILAGLIAWLAGSPAAAEVAGFRYAGSLARHTYWLSNDVMTWAEARALCEQSGGHLATISGQTENDLVALIGLGEPSALWIGLTDEEEEDTWTWVTGEPFVYANWVPGQPQGGNGENAVSMNPADHDEQPGKWHDQSTTGVEFHCVLEFEVPTLLHAASFGLSEYWISSGPLTWEDARDLCAEQGGHLATVSNAAENSVIAQCGAGAPDAVWIGLTDEGHEGAWSWISGETLAYTNWVPGQPEGGSGENVASMNPADHDERPGGWHDQNGASLPFHFVMERPAFTYVATHGSSEYWISTAAVDWSTAVQRCEDLGGHLVTIRDQEENDLVAQLGNGDPDALWIGLTDEGHEGEWNWITGEPFGYANWVPGQPEGGSGENVVSMNPADHDEHPGGWHDQNAASEFHYVVERELPGLAYVTTVGTTEYWISLEATSWMSAEAICLSHGGHLATISSEEENDVVAQCGIGAPDALWIGLTDEGHEGEWTWVSGEPLDYENWLPGQPQGGGYENVASMNPADHDEQPGCWHDQNAWNVAFHFVMERAAPPAGIGGETRASTACRLDPPQPNPMPGAGTLSFELPQPAQASLVVIDASGRVVRVLFNGPIAEGSHRLAWDGRDEAGSPLPRGIYFCRLSAAGQTDSRKILLTR